MTYKWEVKIFINNCILMSRIIYNCGTLRAAFPTQSPLGSITLIILEPSSDVQTLVLRLEGKIFQKS